MKEVVLSLAVLFGSVSAIAANTSVALAQDMSNGANNFYKSDKVDREEASPSRTSTT